MTILGPEGLTPEQRASKKLDLLPCPFCGGAAVFCNDQPHEDGPHECHYVVCTICKLSIEWNYQASMVDSETVDELRQHGARMWNTRASNEPSARHPMLEVVAICDAYESGMGQGLKNPPMGEYRNPYDPVHAPHESRAYGLGYDEGCKRSTQPPRDVYTIAGWLNRASPYQFCDIAPLPTTPGNWEPVYLRSALTKGEAP